MQEKHSFMYVFENLVLYNLLDLKKSIIINKYYFCRWGIFLLWSVRFVCLLENVLSTS